MCVCWGGGGICKHLGQCLGRLKSRKQGIEPVRQEGGFVGQERAHVCSRGLYWGLEGQGMATRPPFSFPFLFLCLKVQEISCTGHLMAACRVSTQRCDTQKVNAHVRGQ